MMWTTLEDVRGAMVAAIRRSARAVGIENPDEVAPADLLSQIEPRSEVVHRSLVAFLMNLAAWYELHVEIERSGKAGNLNATETRELMKRIEQKQSAAVYLANLLRN